jgi:Ca-activated chloride channel family protein
MYLLPLLLTTFAAPRSEALNGSDLWLRADQQGLRALESGEPERAAELFEDPRWRGTAAYSGKDYATAADAFRGDESADGWYNRGNALAAQGETRPGDSRLRALPGARTLSSPMHKGTSRR